MPVNMVSDGFPGRHQAEAKTNGRRHDKNAGVAMCEIEKFTDHGGHVGAGSAVRYGEKRISVKQSSA